MKTTKKCGRNHSAQERLLASLGLTLAALDDLLEAHARCAGCDACWDARHVLYAVELFRDVIDGRTVPVPVPAPRRDWRSLLPAGTTAPNPPAQVAAAFGLLRAWAAAEELRDACTRRGDHGLAYDAEHLGYHLELCHEALYGTMRLDGVLTAEQDRLRPRSRAPYVPVPTGTPARCAPRGHPPVAM